MCQNTHTVEAHMIINSYYYCHSVVEATYVQTAVVTGSRSIILMRTWYTMYPFNAVVSSQCLNHYLGDSTYVMAK